MEEEQYKQMLLDIAEELENVGLPQFGWSAMLNEEQLQIVKRRVLDSAIVGYKAGLKRGKGKERLL
jgi:hypothetical protein